MPIDRDAALRTAERLLRQGKLDGAIEQYVRLVEDQPRDWNAINALGDLYVRAGDMDRAVAQYVRIADFLYGEGFLPKAAALYKKALKVRTEHEHTLLRLSDIAAQQGLLADAKLYLRQLAQQRRSRGDEKGAAECVIRVGTLDDGDGDGKVAAARAAQGIGEVERAVGLLEEAAAAYEKQKREPQALDALVAAAELAPDNGALRSRVAQALIAAGQPERAQPFLAGSSATDDPDLLLALGRSDLLAGRTEAAYATIMRAIVLAPDREASVRRLVDELLASGRVGEAYGCVEILVDAALFEAAFDRAAALLDSFLASARVSQALLKLVDVCVDAGFDDRVTTLQAQLADAYLDEGRAAEARVIAEDLIARAPHVQEHVQRLRRALVAQGVDNPDELIEDLQSAPIFGEPLDFMTAELPETTAEPSAPLESLTAPSEPPATEPANVPEPLATAVPDPPSGASTVPPVPPESFEIDLSDTLTGLMASAPAVAPPSTAAPIEDANGLDQIFEQFRARAARGGDAPHGDTLLERAQEHLRHGRTAEAVADLQAAARAPQHRFRASAQLGRLAASRGDLSGAIDWLEHAAAAPSPQMDETYSVLYDLADALERIGEPARALAVFLELEADAGRAYRDLPERVARLTTRATGAPTSAHGDRA